MANEGKSSWVFVNPVFWVTVQSGLSVSIVAKFLVNTLIPPPSNPRVSAISDTIIPYPPGRFAITHAEHWHDGWPDYTEGPVGWIADKLGGWLERFVQSDNMESWTWFVLIALLLFVFSAHTIGKNRDEMLFSYIGLGLLVAAMVSNQGEVALFGHATDFVFFRFNASAPVFVFNFADVMVVVSLLLLVFASPTYSRRRNETRKLDPSSSP